MDASRVVSILAKHLVDEPSEEAYPGADDSTGMDSGTLHQVVRFYVVLSVL